MEQQTVYETDNNNDRNYSIAKQDYCNFINIHYLTSGIFLNKTLHNGLFEKKNSETKNKEQKQNK